MYKVSVSTTRETVMRNILITVSLVVLRLSLYTSLSEYQQGDSDEYRDNLSTTTETLMCIGIARLPPGRL